MMKKILLLLLIQFLILASHYEAGAAKDTTGRYAVIVGSNDGGQKRVRLQYAVSDASSVIKLLHTLGGVLPENGILLVEPDRESLLSGIKIIQGKIKNNTSYNRTEFIFYYSGHSDEEALLLGKERIPYHDIKGYINDIPADVRIAILDSCSSGVLTRLKGGKIQSPFLSDSSFNMKGYAFMTSSSSDEASQESDRIQGSYFTHYLVSGLRGAADMNQDKCITLSEAYQFAYNETIAGTEKTMSGPQHPNYHIQMSGTGDVIMTDIRNSSTVMIIGGDIDGKLYIRDKNNNLVCELKKIAGRTIQFGLEDGDYSITCITEKVYEARIKLEAGKQFILSRNNFKLTDREYAIARGDIVDGKEGQEEKEDNEYIEKKFSFSLVPDMIGNEKTIHRFSFNLLGSYSARLDGISFGIGPGLVKEHVRGIQANAIGNYSGGSVTGAQVSTIFNTSADNMTGFQGACIFNYAGGDLLGSQVSTVSNVTLKDVKGAQVSDVFNYAGGTVTGAQVCSVVNMTAGDIKGIQMSAVANIADNVKGAQISMVNIADDFKGLQLGLVNISDTQSGLPIGLVNISKNGGIDAIVWGSTFMAANTGVMFRANYIYTIFSVGWMNLDKKISESLSFGFNLGVHLPAGSFFVDIDAGSVSIDNKKIFSEDDHIDQQMLEARIMPGYRITKNLSVFAGAGVSYIYNSAYDDENTDFKNGKFRPLFLAGVRYSLYGNE